MMTMQTKLPYSAVQGAQLARQVLVGLDNWRQAVQDHRDKSCSFAGLPRCLRCLSLEALGMRDTVGAGPYIFSELHCDGVTRPGRIF